MKLKEITYFLDAHGIDYVVDNNPTPEKVEYIREWIKLNKS